MAKQKKKRAKAVSRPLSKFQKKVHSNLHNIWFAGGHCLNKTECYGANSEAEIDYVLSKRQSWAVMVIAFCEDDIGYFADTKVVNDIPPHITHKEMAGIVERKVFEHCDKYPDHQLISPGYFLVPSTLVELESSRDAIVDLFKGWGAFDRETCNVAWACKASQSSNGQASVEQCA